VGNSLKDKVVIVTGGGRGIGRAISLFTASEGACVVVNDIGVTASGHGSDVGPAQETVNDIVAQGGRAVASLDSVATWEGAQAIIETALSSFGHIDCVVNNAGILRDTIFHKLAPEDFDAVVKVHLYGAYYVSRAAAPHMKNRGSGSFVHMTSASGLIGNLGQANYSAAKLGIAGLSRSIAIDMARFNVRSNAVSPAAWSRMTSDLPTDTPVKAALAERVRKGLPAEKIAPLVAFLASDASATVTGQILSVRGNEIFLYSQPRPVRTIHRADGWTVDTLTEQMLPAFKSSFTPLETIGEVFSWDPI
jgi:NAD(P)-dependent dehydrogenase (short-subunit alcohol dehydrogenase family)